MAISFNCPSCKKPYKVKNDLAGKKVFCMACKKPMRVPAPTAQAAADSSAAEELALAALVDEPAAAEGAPSSEDTFKTECPNCMESVAFPLKMAGKQSQCPECRRIVRVPQPPENKKTDWRSNSGRPTFAKVDTEQPSGAWGSATQSSVVSRDALVEAAVIKTRRDRAATTGQKVTRGVIILSTLALAGIGWMLWKGQKAEKFRDDYMKQALALRDNGEESKQPSYLGSELMRAAAEYQLRLKRGNPEEARRYIRAALDFPGGESAERSIERSLTLGDVALTACDAGKATKWDEAMSDLRRAYQTLGRADATGREGVFQAIARGAAKLGAPVADQPDGFTIANFALDGSDPRDLAEARAAAGLELISTGEAGKAKSMELCDATMTMLNSSGEAQPTPRVVAWLVALNKQALMPNLKLPAGEPQPAVRIGFAEGLARAGDVEGGRKVVAIPGRFDDRFAAMVALAGATKQADDARAAVELLEKELGARDFPEWPLIRLGTICSALSDAAVGKQLADALEKLSPTAPKQLAARAWVLGTLMKSGAIPAEEAKVKAIHPPASAGALLAWESLARRAAATSGPLDVSGWGEFAKPLGLAGTALGLLDRK